MAKTQATQLLCWLQLLFSVLLATSIVYGYLNYRISLGQFIESLAATVSSISDVVGRTAETVETKQSLVASTKQTIAATRRLIKELNASAANQAKLAPQYANDLQSAANLAVRLGDALSAVGDGFMFSAPTSVQLEGIRPVILMSRPLEKQGQLLKTNAQEIKAVGSGLLNFSSAIANDGAKLGAELVATSQQALNLLEETEKTLDRLQGSDLPKALQDMRSTSGNLRKISQDVSIAGSIGTTILVFGLLLSGWCFLNSLNLLMLAKRHSTDSVR